VDRRTFIVVGVAALAAPLAAEAQQAGQIARIGWLTTTPPPPHISDAFLGELRKRGWVDGRNIVLERRFSYGRRNGFRSLRPSLSN
jgi:putative tryptophan/tyrosine transport system substrate-binding protein